MTAGAVDFERLLAAEGLAPIDRPPEGDGGPRVQVWTYLKRGRQRLEGTMARSQEVGDPARAETVEVWVTWAREVLKTHRFDSEHQRRIWRLYAKGTPLTKITGELGLSRRSVTRALERVRRWATPAPCDNPWLKGPACRRPDYDTRVRGLLLRLDRRKVAGLCVKVLLCADKARLREIFDGDENLMALVPPDEAKGHTMAEAKRVTYDKILLKRGVEIHIPRRKPPGARSVDRFQCVEGKPHAGGIDVYVDTLEEGRSTITVITLPWDIIAQAERTAGAE